MCLHKKAISGFTAGTDWGSKEYAANVTWFENFSTGAQFTTDKIYLLKMRAVRTF